MKKIDNPEIKKPEIQPEMKKTEIKKSEIQKPEIKKSEIQKPIQPESKKLIDDEPKEEEPIFDEDLDQPINPIDKVIQKEKKENPESNFQFEIGKKTPILPQYTSGGRGTLSSTLNKNLNDLEAEKARKNSWQYKVGKQAERTANSTINSVARKVANNVLKNLFGLK